MPCTARTQASVSLCLTDEAWRIFERKFKMTKETKPRQSLITRNRRYIRRAGLLLDLVAELTRPANVFDFRGPTVTEVVKRLNISSTASIYRFLDDLRDLGFCPIRVKRGREVRYSLPPGSTEHLAIRLARVVVVSTGVASLVTRFDDVIATHFGGKQ